jgi:hypothetical protein
MTRVYIVAEGQTEQAFISAVLAPFLGQCGVHVAARLVGPRGRGGGNVTIHRLRKDICRFLLQEERSVCSTMFDYYGLAPDFPGKDRIAANQSTAAKAETIETALRDEIAREMDSSFDCRRFIPYVQMHEFEGLLFSDPAALAHSLGNAELQTVFREIREGRGIGTPEDINDGRETCPSRRIEKVCRYDKPASGIAAAKAIGLEKMREECPHFSAWVAKLESLGDKA